MEIRFGNKSRGIFSTGISYLDDMTQGLEPGRVYVIAARPSMGKTSLLLQILTEVCVKQQVPSLFFSGDLTIPHVIDRLIFNRALVPLSKLHDPASSVTKGDLQRIQKSALELVASGLILNDSRDLTIEEVAAISREERAKAGIGFVVIDHLHLIRSESTRPGTSRKHEMARVIRAIRNLARELELPILVSAHLKRRADGRLPTSGDIRESRAIEYEADFIGLLHREGQMPNEDCVELRIDKNHNGPTGAVTLILIPEIQRFDEFPTVASEESEVIQAWQDDQWEKVFLSSTTN